MSLRINRVLYVQINENKNLRLIVGVNGHTLQKILKRGFFLKSFINLSCFIYFSFLQLQLTRAFFQLLLYQAIIIIKRATIFISHYYLFASVSFINNDAP